MATQYRGSEKVGRDMVQAFLDGDAERCAAVYSDDAVLYGLGPTFECHGRSAIRDEFIGMFAAMKINSFDWDDHHEVHGDIAYHWGTWTMVATMHATKQKIELSARTLDVRKRQPDGTWLMVIDHASVPLPPPPSS